MKLYVYIPRRGTVEKDVKEVEFPPSMRVQDALESLRSTYDLEDDSDAIRYGLFMMSDDEQTRQLSEEEKFERGWWLNDESQLDNYMLKAGDSILVKNKIRLLYVSTLDHTKKAHRIDDSHDVKRIVNTVCNKLSIKNPEEYSFCEDPHWDEESIDGMDGTLTTLGRATLGGYSTMKSSGMGTMKGSTMRGGQTLRPGETSTLKKKKVKDQIGEKLEKMANKKYRTYERKLFTDAKIKWLKPSETLRQQDIIHPLQPVMLRRKFFYADANVEEHDPVQLNLLYEQCRDSIVKEEYPVTRRKAAELAGIQATILHGKFVKGETNTKLDLDNMFPACHVKKDRKTTLKEVQAEWENQSNNHEKVDIHHMKHLYVSICRGLPTYGITCFLVKEKEPGRNRMVPRLLGISKEAVYRLDNDTKEILKRWQLESIKRWAAGPKNATLDFGEYQQEPYAVKTQVGEGEKIVQLISGYIDIIMAKRAGADKFDQQGQEGATCVMYQNQPKKPHIVRIGANANQNLIQSGQPIRPGIMHHNSQAQEAIQSQFDSKKNIQHIDRPVQQPMRPHLLPFQTTIKDNIDRLDNVRDNLKGTLNAPSHTDPDWLRDQKLMKSHQIESTIAQTAAHTAELVNKFPSEERLNSDQLPLAVNGIVQQIKQLPVPIKDFAALHLDEPDKSDGIINAADQLINSLTDMLKAAQVEESDSMLDAKRKIQNAAHEVSSALENILTFVNDGSENGAYKLVELASHVAHATSDLVNRVKTIASRSDRLDEPDSPEKALVMAATRSANAATQLVAVARITAPTIYDPACQQQLADAMKDVSMAIKQIFPHDMDKSWLQSGDLDALRDATGRVSDALAALIGHMKRGVSPSKATKYDELLMATQQLSGITDREELIQCVRSISTIAIGPQGLVHALNADADDAQSQARRDRLNMAVRSVMAATASVVEAAKSVAERQNAASKEKLAAAAGELGQATENAVRLQQKKEALQNLLDAVKQAAGAATQFVAPAKVSIQFNTNPNTANQLNIENQALQKHVPSMIRAARDCTEQPDSSTNQQALIKTAEDFAAAAHRTIGASRTAQPTIEDHNAKLMLKGATDKLAAALNALQTATHAAGEVFESSPLETACDMVASARDDLKKMEEQAAKGQLRANPGDDRQAAAQQLSTQVKTTCSVVPQLLTCAAQTDDNALNSAAMSAANAVQGLKEAVRSSAATGQRDEQLNTVQAGSAVVGSIHELLLNARDGMNARDSAGNRQKLYGVAKDLTLALNDMLNCLPGQKEIETSMQRVKEAQERQKQFNEGAISSKGNFHDAAESLKIAAEDTNQAAGNLVGASRGEVRDIVLASSEFANDYESLVDAGLNVAAHTAPGPDRQDVLNEMSHVAKASNKLLFASKEIACDLANPGYRQNLQQAAKELTDAINDLITKCTAAAPGQASCDAALRQLTQSRDQLNMFAPVEGKDDYFTILDQIITVHSKRLGDAMTGMYQHTRESNLDAFNNEVGAAAKTLVALAEDAGSAAYIVGISDPASIPGRGGLLNQSEFTAASEQIQQAIRDLQDDSCAQDRLVHAVTIVAKQTGQLCNLCRAAKERAQRPEQRKQFMHAAKDLANATTELVAKIKAYGQTQSPENRQAVNEATVPLDQSTRSLLAFSQSPEFAPVQPILSEHAKLAQAPITGAADSMLAGGVEMISTLKKLVANPTNHAEWSSLTGSSKKVSESIKQLIQSIRESAPGQTECDAAIDMVNKSLRTLNDASIDALGNSLARCDGDLANHVDNLVAVLAEIDAVTGPLSQAACQDATQLGSRVTQTGQFSSPLASSTIAVASLSQPSSRQVDLIDHAKTVGEALLQLVYAAKEAGGNRNIESAHDSVHESVDMVRDAVHEFRAMLNESPEAATSSLIAAVEQSQQKLDQAVTCELGQSELHSALFFECRALSDITQQLSSANDAAKVAELTVKTADTFEALCTVATNAHIIADSKAAANSIKSSARGCGVNLIDLIKAAALFQDDTGDTKNKKNLHQQCRAVSDAVGKILGILTVSSASAQAAHQLTNKIQSIISDLDTDILFAQAGNYGDLADSEDDVNFSTIISRVAHCSRDLTEHIRTLVKGVETGDAQSLKETLDAGGDAMGALSDVVKETARFVAKEGTNTQLILLNAVKNVAESLNELVGSTRINSQNHQFNTKIIDQLRQSSTTTVFSITKLVKAVQIIRDDQLKGPTALQNVIDVLAAKSSELAFDKVQVQSGTPEPEELIQATRPLTMAAGRAVQVGKSCNTVEVLKLCTETHHASVNLIDTVVAIGSVTENETLRRKVLSQTQTIIADFGHLLTSVHDRLVKGDTEIEVSMSQYSHRVAGGISELCRSAHKLKGDGWEDPNDPNVIAEKELLNAAAAIEAAAAKLAQLKPRKEATSKANENLNFDEQILEAAKSIAVATKFLVQSASAAQKELVLQGRIEVPTGVTKDKTGQFSQGLVSAAQMVAAATSSMCEAANDLVIGENNEETLEAAARQVSGATSQLLVACKVKADPDSETMHRLDKAGQAVKKASEDLTKAAKDAREAKDEAQTEADYSNETHVQRRRREMEALAEMQRRERELMAARKKYDEMMKRRYNEEQENEE